MGFVINLLIGLSLGIAQAGMASNLVNQEPVQCAAEIDGCTNNNIHRDERFAHLCVKVKVVDGQLKVDRENSCLYVTEAFNDRLNRKLTLEVIKKKLFDRVDVAFALVDRLFAYGLNPEDRGTIGKQECAKIADEKAKNLCGFNGSWEEFINDAKKWRPGSTFVQPDNFLELAVLSSLTEISLESPLERKQPDDHVGYNSDHGRVLLIVADPIADWNTPEYKICIGEKCDDSAGGPPTVALPKDIRGVLKPLVGQLWDKSQITAFVQEYYAGKGLLATVDVGSAFEDSKTLKIKESPRLWSITFPRDTKPADVDKAVYLLLPDREFRRFRKCREDFVAPDDGLSPLVVELRELFHRGDCGGVAEEIDEDLPYLNIIKLQLQKLQLGELDLDVAVGTVTEEGEEHVFLQVAEVKETDKEVNDKEADTQKGENDKAVPLPNKAGIVDTNLTKPETNTTFVPRVTVSPSALPPPTAPSASPTPPSSASPTPSPSPEESDDGKKKKRNYLGGGFEYSSGHGASVFGIYQRSKLLFNNDGFSLQVGGHDKPFGSVNYFADYVGFSKLGRRLTLQFTGSSLLNAQRIFSGQDTDERRTGGQARAELELFRDRGGNLLRLYLDGQQATVQLNQDNLIVSKQSLTTIDFGALYVLQPDYELDYPRWARLEPRLRFGLGLAQNEPRFNAIFMSGNFHQKLPRFFEVDISGRLGLTSRNAPIFEQASLGGADSVRGFRRDEAIGQQMWSLQNELWIPVPGTTNSSEDFRRFLLRSVRLTAFADVGGISRTTGSRPGTRFGPGTGLRFIFNPIVIKLDWAYGLTSANVTTARGRFSFSIVSNLPF